MRMLLIWIDYNRRCALLKGPRIYLAPRRCRNLTIARVNPGRTVTSECKAWEQKGKDEHAKLENADQAPAKGKARPFEPSAAVVVRGHVHKTFHKSLT
jgi:hypothetical protein